MEQATLSDPVHSGIAYRLRFPGLVAEYEEYAAMTAAHWNEREWETLSPAGKARAVAHYRLSRLERAHGDDAQAKAAKRRGGKR